MVDTTNINQYIDTFKNNFNKVESFMSETFSSQSTDSFLELLSSARCSTHFMEFDRPMGIARRNNEVAVGGVSSITLYRNLAAAGPKAGQGDQTDACYIPRVNHVTGNKESLINRTISAFRINLLITLLQNAQQ